MTLADYVDKHKGESAWVFGKGPSLKSFDFTTAGRLRLAINDTIAHVPDCTYGFANDGVKAWADVYRKGQVLFQPNRCQWQYEATKQGAVDCDVVLFDDDYNDPRLHCDAAELAKCLTVRRGTLGSLLQIGFIMGIRHFHLVGIDGGCVHAEGYQFRTRLRADHGKDYDAIRSAAIDQAEIMGLTLHFHTKENIIMENNGKKYVQFLRNSLAKGVHHPQGSIASFSPALADELIGVGAAQSYVPPVKAAPEKASLEPKAEVAASPAPKKRGKSKKS